MIRSIYRQHRLHLSNLQCLHKKQTCMLVYVCARVLVWFARVCARITCYRSSYIIHTYKHIYASHMPHVLPHTHTTTYHIQHAHTHAGHTSSFGRFLLGWFLPISRKPVYFGFNNRFWINHNKSTSWQRTTSNLIPCICKSTLDCA